MSKYIAKFSKVTAVIEECTVKLSGQDPFGQVSGGVLRLRGCGLDIMPEHLGAYPHFYPDNEGSLAQSPNQPCRCVPIAEEKPWDGGVSAHCLVLAPNDDGSYMRVGLLHCSEEDFQNMLWVDVFDDISLTVL